MDDKLLASIKAKVLALKAILEQDKVDMEAVISTLKELRPELTLALSQLRFQEQARKLIEEVGPHLGWGCDYADPPVIPEGCSRIAVVRHSANAITYGFDTIYLVWEINGKLRCEELVNSRSTQERLCIKKAQLEDEGKTLVIEVGPHGSFSDAAWSKIYRIPLDVLYMP